MCNVLLQQWYQHELFDQVLTAYLTIRRVDDFGEEATELSHVPVVLRQLVDVQTLRVKRDWLDRVRGWLRNRFEPVADDDVTSADFLFVEDVASLDGGRFVDELDEAVPFELSCNRRLRCFFRWRPSTEVALALLTQLLRVRFSAFTNIFREISGNSWCCWDLSTTLIRVGRERIKTVDQTQTCRLILQKDWLSLDQTGDSNLVNLLSL